MVRQQTHPISIYQLKLTLRDSEPLVWRRILVAADTTLPRLHHAIQAVMGWLDYHLHAFQVDDVEYMQPDPDLGFDPGQRSEQRVHLDQVRVRPGRAFHLPVRFWRRVGA